MDYEKEYKEIVGQIRKAYLYAQTDSTKAVLEEIFPELAESEDEKIRKEIVRFIQMEVEDEIVGNKWIAWLEKQVEERKITHEEICKSYGIPDIGEFSDGYHTFNGLYKQRMILFAVLVKTYKDRAWKSWKHEDGLDCFGGGWFIVGIDTPAGTYTYHYEAKDWDRFDCQILEKAKHWDGHDESDVERLFSLVSNANKDEVIRCLINGMKFYYEDNEEATWGTQKFSMKVKDILDWLEKQGEKHPDPYNGISFEYNGHIWGMCARDGGVEILMDGNITSRVFPDKNNIIEQKPTGARWWKPVRTCMVLEFST